MATLTIGSQAPDFTLPTGDGKSLSLSELRGRKVVLYFYSKDNTSGCTKEACSFRDNLSMLRKKGALVVGVSIDSPESHSRFASKHELTFPLVSDSGKKIVKLYGVWKQKSMYGRKYMGTERTTFIIDEKGIIIHIFPKVKVDGHIDQILEIL